MVGLVFEVEQGMEPMQTNQEIRSSNDIAAENRRLREALEFVAELTGEALEYARVGTGEEVALRHANRKATEALRR